MTSTNIHMTTVTVTVTVTHTIMGTHRDIQPSTTARLSLLL
jgi:hypothetical protein